MPTPQTELHNYFQTVSKNLESDYNIIFSRSTEDPGTAGDRGEANWVEFFKNWLSPQYIVEQKGRIINEEGITSPQIDILILSPNYPKFLVTKKAYLSAGVIAAFECKNTLTAADVQKTIKNSKVVKNLFSPRIGSPYRELYSPIIYGLIAHSHSWKSPKSTPVDNIERALWKTIETDIEHPREMLDIICVADLCEWSITKMPYIGPNINAGSQRQNEIVREMYGDDGAVLTGYVRCEKDLRDLSNKFCPIGALYQNLYHSLAYEYPELRQFADYLVKSNISGPGSGHMKKWPKEVYSDVIKEEVFLGRLKFGEKWSEWNSVFI